jgi:hypothetical protein
MHRHAPAYGHLLLYQCQQCDEPIAISVKSDEANLEGVDGSLFDVQCKCGSLKKSFGAQAKSHWVSLWENSPNIDPPRPRIDGDEELGRN